MLNELCQLEMAANSDAMGCTFGTVPLPSHPRGQYQYLFFDTAGLNETDQDESVVNKLLKTSHN
jgi:hypothetical protein